MIPGIHPSKVRTILSRKLPSRPVINTATGGSTIQKKYRNAFIDLLSLFSAFLLRPSAARNLRSPDWKADRGKVHAAVSRYRHLLLRDRSQDICRCERCELPAFPSASLRPGQRRPADRALLLLASPPRELSLCKRSAVSHQDASS